jgi:hypothetical protein
MILTLDQAILANTPQGRAGGGDESPPEWGLIDIPDWQSWSREEKFKLVRAKGFQDLGDGRVYVPDDLLHTSPSMRDKGPLGLGEPLKVLTVFGTAIAGAGAISSAFPGAAATGGAELAGTGASAFTDYGAWNTGFGNAAALEGANAIAAGTPSLANVASGLRTASTIANAAGSVVKLAAGTPAVPQASPLVVAHPLVFGVTGQWPSLEPRSAAPTLDADQAQPFGTVTAPDPAAAKEASSSSATSTVIASLVGAVLVGLVAFART